MGISSNEKGVCMHTPFSFDPPDGVIVLLLALALVALFPPSRGRIALLPTRSRVMILAARLFPMVAVTGIFFVIIRCFRVTHRFLLIPVGQFSPGLPFIMQM